MFSDELEKISWEETTVRINSKTDADVRRALSKEHCDVEDFMALISPAAVPYLETMARLSKKYTEDFHVCAIIYYELLHQLLCVLWFSHQQSHAPYHTDGGGNCQ
jgi:regulator of replication initiation timing